MSRPTMVEKGQDALRAIPTLCNDPYDRICTFDHGVYGAVTHNTEHLANPDRCTQANAVEDHHAVGHRRARAADCLSQ